MAATNSTNLVIPEIMRTEVNVEFAKIFDLSFMGAAERDDTVPAGELINVRGFNELSGDAEVMVDGGTYSTNPLSTNKDVAVILHRIKKFGAEDLGRIVSGMDATAAVRAMIARYFLKEVQNRFLNVLEALFDSSAGVLRSSNRLSVYVDHATVGRGFLTPANGATVMSKIGDNMFDLGVWAMHSATYAYLLANKYLETNTNGSAYGIDGVGNIVTFMGKPIMVSDFCTKVAGASATMFRTYLLGRGSLYLGIQKDINPEYSRDSNKIDIISTDMHFATHCRGVKWNTTTNPTNALLATPASWALSYALAKQVRVVALDHNNPE